MQKSTGLQCILLKWESSGLGEDELLSGALLRAAERAALLPASTQAAAIHSTVTLPSAPGILPILKRKRDMHGTKIQISLSIYIYIYQKNPHQKKQMKNTHLQKVISKEIPQKSSSLKEKKPSIIKNQTYPKSTTLQGRQRWLCILTTFMAVLTGTKTASGE